MEESCPPEILREWSEKENIQRAADLQMKMFLYVKGERRMDRADKEGVVIYKTTRYNQGIQKSMSGCTTGTRKPHWVLLLSANNSKLSLLFTQAHKHWTEDLGWL